jgi:uncharacterized MAPEG superfamily protein
MSAQLTWLAYTTLLTSVLWIPYILDSFIQRGIMGTLSNPQDQTKPLSSWAVRFKAAHYNGVENLVIFAILVIIAEYRSIDVSQYAQIYFLARVGHPIVYAAGIPGLRTLLFLTGFAMQILIFFNIIG